MVYTGVILFVLLIVIFFILKGGGWGAGSCSIEDRYKKSDNEKDDTDVKNV
jgi:hypothetical protein